MNLNPTALSKRLLHKRAGGSASVSLASVKNDVLYSVPMSIGTPPQKFNLAIDTGSPTTWVAANTCQSNGCLGGKTFTCSASSTCQVTQNGFNFTYVDGQGVSGAYVVETYNIGALSFKGVAGIATRSDSALPTTIDGIMGLWYYAPGSPIPILNVLKNTTALAQNLISVYLRPSLTNAVTAPGGEITFGGVNTARFIGDITYVNCVAERPWSIPVAGLSVGNTKINVGAAIATIDTGTTAMLMPQVVADALHENIPGAVKVVNLEGLWFLPCNGNTDITITFGTFAGKLPYSSLAMQRARQKVGTQEYCLSAAMFPTEGIAVIDEWLIGAAFLKNVYSVYDFSASAPPGGRVGFANLAPHTDTGSDGGDIGGDIGGGIKDGRSGAVSVRAGWLQAAAAMVGVSAWMALF
ncbi:hypothetical protein BGX34_000251 [Mortierella sp. NVP85]|nr:hypothetical protein BGX34_000251 [Mortierella sp. NVP85]